MNVKITKLLILLPALLVFDSVLSLAYYAPSYDRPRNRATVERRLPGWNTNTTKRTIQLDELTSGGPGKDGIPAIDNPRFIKPIMAEKWLKPVEPVISVVIKGNTRAYPLQILMWHEIVNDNIRDVPIVVTFCPLCYSANVFDRRLQGREYSFGVSGMLRHSDMVMYDRQTESLWQQFTGEAIVGDMVGSSLRAIPSQIISFEQFKNAYKTGLVLSRRTSFRRDYGRNPYAGYDDINNKPFMYKGKEDSRLKPMEKLVAVNINNISKAYPYSATRQKKVINDEVSGESIVVFHTQGAVSALDKPQIASSREDGSTGVFNRKVDNQILTFSHNSTALVDEQTTSTWDITGKAVSGPLKGKTLSPVAHGDYFAFAWLVFKPETEIYLE
ncbi:MAG: DUF3179 domain-containing protein [Planctomycetota bacterium]|jgi:hypothetical protein